MGKGKSNDMRKKRHRIVVLMFTCILLAGILEVCANRSADENKNNHNSKNGTDQTSNQTSDSISGSLTMVGSTSMEKLANAAAEAFMNKYPKVTVSTEFIGSSAGVEALLAKTVDIGNSSRNLKDSEKSSGAVENIVALDGIAVIIDKNNTILNLTKDQLIQIYTGKINNWSKVGGKDEPIVVVGRESGSGTRGAFEELLGVADQCKYVNEISSTGGVMAKVSSIPGTIGYVSLDVLDETVAVASIDGVAPTEENIKEGRYLLNRPFVMATLGEISKQNDLIQTYFEFLGSDEGKEIIKNTGLISID